MKDLNAGKGKPDKKIIFIAVLLVALTMLPLLFQGIMCNDELQTRYWRELGIPELFKHYFSVASAGGRIIGGFVDVRVISFITKNMYINRFVDILLIVTSVILFAYFVYRIHGNKYFSFFIGIMLMVCLPVTFEHGVPNAFVAVTVIPSMLVLGAMLLFWKSLCDGKKRYLALSMLLYLIAMMQYEFVVTYVLMMYFLILKYQFGNGKINWLEAFGQAIIPTAVALFYIVLYFVMQSINASGYAGNTVGFVSVASSLKILYVLAKSSLPGYFLFNEKYRYLKQVYCEQYENITLLIAILILIVVCLFILCMHLFGNRDRGKKAWKWNLSEMAVAAVFMVVPSLPNAISALYQGNVTESFFTWLPVSYFLYFAAVFLICSVLWNIFQYCNKYMLIICSIVIACYVGQIQYMNYINANQQHKDFTRLLAIEKMFDMQLWNQFNGMEAFSEDVYETRNLLAVHDTFWSQYLQKNGLSINVRQGSVEGAFNIYFPNDEYFLLTDGKAGVLCSETQLQQEPVFEMTEGQTVVLQLGDSVEDSGFYLYGFRIDGSSGAEIPVEEAVAQLTNKIE